MSKVGHTLLIGGVFVLMLCVIYWLMKSRFYSNKLALNFSERLGHLKKGFGILLSPKNLSLVILETILIWAFNTLAIWSLVKSLGVMLSVSEVLLLEGITGMAAAIPLSSGRYWYFAICISRYIRHFASREVGRCGGLTAGTRRFIG